MKPLTLAANLRFVLSGQSIPSGGNDSHGGEGAGGVEGAHEADFIMVQETK